MRQVGRPYVGGGLCRASAGDMTYQAAKQDKALGRLLPLLPRSSPISLSPCSVHSPPTNCRPDSDGEPSPYRIIRQPALFAIPFGTPCHSATSPSGPFKRRSVGDKQRLGSDCGSAVAKHLPAL